ncbi:hypothetical protein DY000_02032861 [Brassica cretica]|uniref:Uncharacterized protein n=1 Tax=Brassica cretica TaxID=69181 RepID=A0ABQ7DRQ7_BRACR|nr:hypothetical protein DY000_02032861 [Brassica cretica]
MRRSFAEKKAIKLDPTLARTNLQKGTACMKLEEYTTAKEAQEKATCACRVGVRNHSFRGRKLKRDIKIHAV